MARYRKALILGAFRGFTTLLNARKNAYLSDRFRRGYAWGLAQALRLAVFFPLFVRLFARGCSCLGVAVGAWGDRG